MEMTEEEAGQLNKTINFWKSKLQYEKYLLSPATESLVQLTVKSLEKLRANVTIGKK